MRDNFIKCDPNQEISAICCEMPPTGNENSDMCLEFQNDARQNYWDNVDSDCGEHLSLHLSKETSGAGIACDLDMLSCSGLNCAKGDLWTDFCGYAPETTAQCFLREEFEDRDSGMNEEMIMEKKQPLNVLTNSQKVNDCNFMRNETEIRNNNFLCSKKTSKNFEEENFGYFEEFYGDNKSERCCFEDSENQQLTQYLFRDYSIAELNQNSQEFQAQIHSSFYNKEIETHQKEKTFELSETVENEMITEFDENYLQHYAQVQKKPQPKKSPQKKTFKLHIEIDEKRPAGKELFDESTRNLNIANQMFPVSEQKTGCHCSKTQCLKMYCECFKNGAFCSPECGCTNCANIEENKEKILKLKEFIHKDGKKTTEFCNCRQSFCGNNYCPCVKSGRGCVKGCNCFSCDNPYTEERFRRKKGKYQHQH